MNAISETPHPTKPTWEERYARWMLKPSWGQAQFERWVGPRWHWWWFIGVGLCCMGLMTHTAFRFQDFIIPESLPTFIDAESLAAPQQEQLGVIYREYSQLSLETTLTATFACGLSLVLGFALLLYFIIASLIQSERRGARLIITRLEHQLAEAQKQRSD